MSKFPTKTIEDITKTLIDYRGKTPQKTDNGIKLITAKIIKNGYIQKGNYEYISEETYSKHMRRGFPENGDILITTEAPLGEVAQLNLKEKIALAQRVILLRGDSDIIVQKYYLFALQSPFVQSRLYSRATGTTVLGIKQTELKKVEIPLPPLPIQRKIAGILSAYDDLIENNTRRIEILEEMARMLYREWFVKFRFPVDGGGEGEEGGDRPSSNHPVDLVESELGLIPKGWEVVPIGDVIDFHIGGGWGKDELDEKFSVQAYVIRGTDIPKARQNSLENIPLRFHKASNFKSRKLENNDIILEVSGGSKGQPVGRSLLISNYLLNYLEYPSICASFCKLIRIKSSIINPILIYFHLLEIYEDGRIEKYSVQSTGISNFKFNVFLSEELIIIPDKNTQDDFSQKIQSIIDQIQILGLKNINLRKTRDLLLPRLISGEIDVEALDINLGAMND